MIDKKTESNAKENDFNVVISGSISLNSLLEIAEDLKNDTAKPEDWRYAGELPPVFISTFRGKHGVLILTHYFDSNNKIKHVHIRKGKSR